MSRNRRILAIITVLMVLMGALPAAWCGPEPAQDDDERAERLAAGKNAFRDNCLMCHGEEMTARLRLSDKQWAAELDKMIGWGAPVPPELKPPLLEYLVSAYSIAAGAPVPPPARILYREAVALGRPEGPPVIGDGARGASLYVTHCATCHGPTALGGDLGTCLIERPVLLRPADYTEVVRQGRRRMPGFAAALKPEQEADILAWLRTQRYAP
jgi:ubiquinol-cytochrome c reductase cytochrome c subunit